MSNHFERALFELAALAKRANVGTPMRISITFGTPRDREFFTTEIRREQDPTKYPETCIDNEFQFAGHTVRIV